MAGNAVGSLAVLISANAVDFDRTTTRVVTDTNNLHKRIKPPPAIDFGAVGAGALAKAGPLAVAAGAGLVGMASAGGLVAKTLGTIEDQAKLGAAARAMGLTAQQFTGIAAVARMAGEDTREFIESLVTMGKVISDGVAGKGEVAADFFRTIGVEAKEFAALRTDQQFFKIFESLEKMQDPAQRVRALMVAFGEDGGKQLLANLGKSSAEMRAIAREAATTNGQMRDIESAQAAVVRAAASWDQAWVKVAASMAPIVEAIAKTLPDAIDRLVPKMNELRGPTADTQVGRGSLLGAAGADVARSGAAAVSIGMAGVGNLTQQVIRETAGLVSADAREFADRMKADMGFLSQSGHDNFGFSLRDKLRAEMEKIDDARPGADGDFGIDPKFVRQQEQMRKQAEDARKLAEQRKQDDAARAMAEQARVAGQMGRLREQFATPADKWAAEQKTLNDLFQQNRGEADLFRKAWHAGWRVYADDAIKAIDDPFRRWQETQRLMAEGVRNGSINRDDAALRANAAFNDHANRQRELLDLRGGGAADKFALEARLIHQQGLDPAEQQRRLGQLAMDLPGMKERQEVKLPTAMLKGSQEAESLLSKTIAGGDRKDPAQQLAAGLKALADKQIPKDELERLMGRAMEKAIRDGFKIVQAKD